MPSDKNWKQSIGKYSDIHEKLHAVGVSPQLYREESQPINEECKKASINERPAILDDYDPCAEYDTTYPDIETKIADDVSAIELLTELRTQDTRLRSAQSCDPPIG